MYASGGMKDRRSRMSAVLAAVAVCAMVVRRAGAVSMEPLAFQTGRGLTDGWLLRAAQREIIETDEKMTKRLHDDGVEEDVRAVTVRSGVIVQAKVDVGSTASGLPFALAHGLEALVVYASGLNQQHRSIAIRPPVFAEMTPGAGPWCESHIRIYFYAVDAKNATELPSPRSYGTPAQVQVCVEENARRMVALPLSGRADLRSLQKHLKELHTELDKAHVKHDSDKFTVATLSHDERLFLVHLQ
mmetsp:Transcript_8271/g.24856  ORF Transcript_8271/g.24856 Transcript_8271/m.24856 type:complete len:244 (+) Transcript_8271:98-829(+)